MEIEPNTVERLKDIAHKEGFEVTFDGDKVIIEESTEHRVFPVLETDPRGILARIEKYPVMGLCVAMNHGGIGHISYEYDPRWLEKKSTPSARSGNNRAERSASRHAKTKVAHKARMKQRLKAKKG